MSGGGREAELPEGVFPSGAWDKRATMKVDVAYEFLAKRGSCRTAVVMDHFGIGFETGRHVIARGLELPVREGDVVLFTGASGSGKSSLMRAVAAQLERECGAGAVLNVDAPEFGDRALIDALPVPIGETMHLLSACGLGEAQLMLRTPAELSDGQRYRFRLALALAQQPRWVVADEFTATLDRTLAKVVSYNVRRLCTRAGTGFLLATTHEDVIEDLQPSLHVVCRLDGRIEWSRGEVKKKVSVSPSGCGSARVPSRIGRTSRGGITGATTWGSCGT